MFRHFITLMKTWLSEPTAYEIARASYAPEPRRSANEVALAERIDCIVRNDVKYVLGEVVGLQKIRETHSNDYPKLFREHLPVRTKDLIEFMRVNGLPRRVAVYAMPYGLDRYIYRAESGQWMVTEFDDRNIRWDFRYESKWAAELGVMHNFIASRLHLFVDGTTYKL